MPLLSLKLLSEGLYPYGEVVTDSVPTERAHVSAYYPECYTVQLTHFTFCVSRLDLAKLSTFVLSIRAHVRLIIMCCARGPRGRPVSRPGRSVAERCTAKLKCITAALSCCCHVWAVVENLYITRLPGKAGGERLGSLNTPISELGIPTISSSCTWICLWTSAIWNSTSPAQRERGRREGNT